jgi:two-component system, chemotaxis family, CheB/CheR fusion protein
LRPKRKAAPAGRERRPSVRPKGRAEKLAHTPEQGFRVVGVGASAGGLDAFRNLLGALPEAPGLAVVLVQHLDPQHASSLVELLSRTTRLPIAQVRGPVRVEVDRIYVMPPGEDVLIADGELKLVPRTRAAGLHKPVDYFLRSLAESLGPRAVGVVLSGTGSDGTLGLQAIRSHGGLTLAQDPTTAAHDGMPRSAIDSGFVDEVLAPEEIARVLVRKDPRPPLPPPTIEAGSKEDETDGFKRIVAVLLQRTGADFSAYRATTIKRRVAHRMAIAGIEELPEYVRLVETSAEEAQALQQDCLISVTSFFREPEAFEAFSNRVLPALLEGREPAAPVRVWVPGCATGEEAYSIAISLYEAIAVLPHRLPLQVFATDLSETAVQTARAGSYADAIEQEMSAERLRRFFNKVDGRYQVTKAIREVCVFARHDLTKDPPFSRIDLISCRNVLIYFEPRTQQKVLRNFHYALQVPGFLLLGASESVGPAEELFEAIDKQHRFFAKRPTPSPYRPGVDPGHVLPIGHASEDRSAAGPRRHVRPALDQADRILLARYAPAGVVVDDALHILEFRGDTSPYLDHAPGFATLDLMRMAASDLAPGLRRAIRDAKKTRHAVRSEGISLRAGGRTRRIAIEVIPLDRTQGDAGNLLVIFDAGRPTDRADRPTPRPPKKSQEVHARLAQENTQLRQELAAAMQQLNVIGNEHEAANEELQSANEEALSANEELQSINEELETAKEELQSSNEELSTLNLELNDRNRQLGTLNDDLLNLLTSLNIPVVMLGSDLRLRRFTSAAEKMFNLLPADVGRPLGDLRPILEGIDLEREILEVIDTVQAVDREVSDREGRAHSLSIRPYRTEDNRIDGAVVIILDVDGLRRALDDANAIVDTAREPMIVLDGGLRVERANRSYCETFATDRKETEGHLVYEIADRQWDIPELREALRAVIAHDSPFDDFAVEREFPRVGRKVISLNARRLRYKEDGREKILLGMEDRTDSAALALEREARKKAQQADELKDEFMANLSHELRGPLNTMVGWVHALRRGGSDASLLDLGLGAIDRAVRAQSRLIEDLLDYSRMTLGKLHLSPRLVDLTTLAETAIEGVRGTAEDKGVRIDLVKGPGPTRTVGDGDRLQQVIWNLLSNALKFTPRGGRVEIGVGRVGDELELSVRDTGVGIPADFLPYVFERFRQAETGPRRQHGGLGLGLAIAKQLVELHGGTVVAKSEGESQGATFTVKLPATPATSEEGLGSPFAEPVSEVAGSVLQGLRVLVVEDEPDGRCSCRCSLNGEPR